jgi:threonine/homoserine/homoserine lactone efflux protein
VIVFFGAIVGQRSHPESTSGTAGLLRWGTVPVVLINQTLWYGSLALLFGVTPVRNHYRRIKAVFERSCDGLLIVFGAKVAWSGAHDSGLAS